MSRDAAVASAVSRAACFPHLKSREEAKMKRLLFCLVLLTVAVTFPAPMRANHYPQCQDVCCAGAPYTQCMAGFGPRVITCGQYEAVVPCF